MNLFLKLSIVAAFILTGSRAAVALPQYVQHGYFGCQSCHASPTGGGLLTPYGRSVSREKISTWGRENEEQPFNGALGIPPEWLMFGGNFRQIQTYVENDQIKEGRYFTMQRDLEAGVHLDKLWVVGSVGKETSAYPKEDDHYRVLSRRHFIRYDITEELMVRAGKFYPRFGLMIPSHTSGVRRGMGFDQGQESNNFEVTYGGELIEVSVTSLLAPVGVNQIDDPVSKQRGAYATAAIFFLDRNRASVSFGKVLDGTSVVTKESGAATISVGGLNIMAEIARKRTLVSDDPVPEASVFSYTRVGGDLWQGVTPYLLHEVRIADIHDTASRSDVLAPGLQLNPRPHLEFDVSTGVVVKPAAFKYSSFGVLTFHYYL